MRNKKAVLARLMARVKVNDKNCWVWTGYRMRFGYGMMMADRKVQVVHRIAYKLIVGPIPKGKEIDHLCRNRACCNPDHMEPVTHQENCRRGRAAEVQRKRGEARTHCPAGHPYSGDNVYLRPDGRGKDCKECRRRAVLKCLRRKKRTKL